MSGIGTVTAYDVVDIHTQVTGTIEKIGFVEGQTVHPGSLIVQLDPRPYQAALGQAQANLKSDQANLADARANLARFYPATLATLGPLRGARGAQRIDASGRDRAQPDRSRRGYGLSFQSSSADR